MEQKNKKQTSRPPVVVVMGHIDHGKSTLLDYIRKSNTTEKEAGGITQHISAYEAEIETGGLPAQAGQKRKITFLDTPGHEAFCSVRAYGANVADIAILVVAADDGVKPQTIEALNCITRDSIPFIVALTKTDRGGVSLDKIKQNLAENNILVEGWGGTVPFVPVSGKTGEGVPELLEIVALQADLEELQGDSSLPAQGFVIESELSPKQGISATLIIKDGTLTVGSFVATPGSYAPVRSIENYKGESLKEARFSSPVRIVGWSAQPLAGSEFRMFTKKEEAAQFSAQHSVSQNAQDQSPKSSASLEAVVKADTFGTLAAVEHELKKLGNEKISVKIISKGVGDITENDVKAASVTKCPIVGFSVTVDKSAKALAERENIEIKTYQIIYELVDDVKEKLKAATPVETVEQVVGNAKVLKIFSKNKDKQVIGARVEEGEIKSGATVKIFRREAFIGNGKIKELQTQKIKADTVKEGQECGMMVESKIEIMPADSLQVSSLVRQE